MKKTIKEIAEDYFEEKCSESKNIYGNKVLKCSKEEIILTTKGISGKVKISFDYNGKEDKEIKRLFNNLHKQNKLMSEFR